MTLLAARRIGIVLAVLLLAGLAGPEPARAQRPLTVLVGDAASGWRPVVRINGVLRDRSLRDALRSGLPLRFHYRVELWEKGTFDRLAGADEASFALLRDPLDEGYVLEDGRTERRVPTLREAERAMMRAWTPTVAPESRGRYYYLTTVEIETLSLSDLDELRRWLAGEARPAAEGRAPVTRAVGRGLRRAFVRLLGLPTRRYEVRSAFFEPG